MIIPTKFYGGPHDGKQYQLRDTPPELPINNEDWRGKYVLRDVLGEPCYYWQNAQGRPPANDGIQRQEPRQ